MTTYRVYNIKYDLDEDVKLPAELLIEVDHTKTTDPWEIEEILSDEILNLTGFCHRGFQVEPPLAERDSECQP